MLPLGHARAPPRHGRRSVMNGTAGAAIGQSGGHGHEYPEAVAFLEHQLGIEREARRAPGNAALAPAQRKPGP
jgi:hypothetical protein